MFLLSTLFSLTTFIMQESQGDCIKPKIHLTSCSLRSLSPSKFGSSTDTFKGEEKAGRFMNGSRLHHKVEPLMNLEELYQWMRPLKQIFVELGTWQVLGLAMYSYGVVLARQCAPSKVSEKLALVGQAKTVQRRLERWLANERIDWLKCCEAWSGFVLRHYVGEMPILLLDETKLGNSLSVMVAYRSCCIPLLWWAYQPTAWPMGQVHLIEHLLFAL